MFTSEMRALIEAHTECQLGCYFSDVSGNVDEARYLYSHLIPDTSWNFCIPNVGDDSEIEWGKRQASTAGRSPAFFVPSGGDIKVSASTQLAPEHWMVRDGQPATVPARPTAVTEVREIHEADPGADFGAVFSNLFEDEGINAHFRAYYVPTLRAARRMSAAHPVHLVAYAGSQPIACASLYLLDDFAGLYNVGAKATFQRQGLGAWISDEILRKAGDRRTFLQCETGTHVEKMYQRLGFSIRATPVILTLSDNG